MSQKPLNPDTHYVIVGKLGKSYSVHGWLKVQSFTEPKENLLNYHPWYINRQHKWSILDLSEVKNIGNTFIAKINHIDSPEQTKQYTNVPIAIHSLQLPPLAENEYYWKDLIGLTVNNLAGNCLGKIDYIFNSGAHPIIVVKGNKEYLIPYLNDHFVISIDLTQQKMIVDWDINFP